MLELMQRIIGLDPGLRHTGWGVIQQAGNRLSFVGAGTVSAPAKLAMSSRLSFLFKKLTEVIDYYAPTMAAIEKTFVNTNPRDALTLGQARGVVMLVPANAGLDVHEYAANKVKKTVTGAGHADKSQMMFMVQRLLPGAEIPSADAADALAIAICHAQHAPILERLAV